MQDREAGIRDALVSLSPLDWERRTSRQLIEIYIECETLRSRESRDGCYSMVAHEALVDTCLHLGVSPDKKTLDKAVGIILKPRLRVDAIEAISALHRRGYTLLGIPSLDPSTFSQYFQPHIPPEIAIDIPHSAWASPHAQNPALFPALLQRFQRSNTEITPAQILIVTTGPYRVVEPACTAGFPVVLLQTALDMESKVIFDTATPTLIVENLSALCDAMNGPELSNPSIVPPVRPSYMFPPYRVCDHYQVTRIIGSGSFSMWMAPSSHDQQHVRFFFRRHCLLRFPRPDGRRSCYQAGDAKGGQAGRGGVPCERRECACQAERVEEGGNMPFAI